ncbi:MAG TPA: hypothetical protein VH592_05305 [Gemmataceae bacterium]
MFHEGVGKGSGSTFVLPLAIAPALGIQAAQAGSSNVLGGSVSGINFELLGNLPSLLSPSNVMQGTTNTTVQAAQLTGAPYGGSVLGRVDLFTDRSPGATAPFALMHPQAEEREEPLPENPPTPPDDQWWVSDPQAGDLTLHLANMFLRERSSVPGPDLKLLPDRPLPVETPIFDPRLHANRDDFLFNEDDAGMSADEDQSEKQSGISPAVAILSCAVGAYWAPRFRSSRKVAAALHDEDSDR